MFRALVYASLALSVTAFARAQVVFNDNFNGSDFYNNDGAGSVNPTADKTAFHNTGGGPSQGQNGALFTPGSGYNSQESDTRTGASNGGTAYSLGAAGTNFSFTVNDITVGANSAAGGRSDIPESGDAGFRFELGVLSVGDTNNDAQLFLNNVGGVYLTLFYDQQGNLTGNLRAVDSTHPTGSDSSGTQGIFELASFTIAQPSGTTSSYTTPLTATLSLSSTGYSLGFDQTATLVSGSLSGTYSAFSALEAGDLSSGVKVNLLGQGWSNGFGSGNIRELQISEAPEPSVTCLLGAAALFAGAAWRRRLVRA